MTAERTFRNSTAFGKPIEYRIIDRILIRGLDVYVPVFRDTVSPLRKPRAGTWRR